MTTNGIGLARLARPLREAGLDRINVSLDTLGPDVFRTLAQRDRLADVLAGLAAAAAAGLAPVKVNTVLMRGVNDDEAARAAAVLPGPRVSAAVHRADAAGRPARLAPGEHGHRGRDPGALLGGVHAHPGRPGARADPRRRRRSWWTAARPGSA